MQFSALVGCVWFNSLFGTHIPTDAQTDYCSTVDKMYELL